MLSLANSSDLGGLGAGRGDSGRCRARHGLVERSGCDVDRRGIYVVLTEAGEQRHAQAVPTHRDILARLLPASMLSAASGGG